MVKDSYDIVNASANLLNKKLPVNKRIGTTKDVLLREKPYPDLRPESQLYQRLFLTT